MEAVLADTAEAVARLAREGAMVNLKKSIIGAQEG